jgi:hypothetical protein
MTLKARLAYLIRQRVSTLFRNERSRRATHVLDEVVEEGSVLLADELGSLVGGDDGVLLVLLGLDGVLVKSGEELVAEDELAVALGVVDLNVGELGVNAKSEVGRKSPRGGGPGEEGNGGVLDEREGDGDCERGRGLAELPRRGGDLEAPKRTSRVLNIFVSLSGLKVGERSGAAGGVRHNLESAVDEVLLPQLSKDPPDRLHKRSVEGLVVVVEVNPPSQALDGTAPFGRVPHHDGAALGVVLVDSHGHDVGLGGDTELLVDLVLDGEAVGIPTEAAFDVEAVRVSEAGDNVL